MNAITQLEKDLLSLLKEEYSFYQSLYILLDKQRDLIRFDKDDLLLDLYAEIERCQRRIKDSESKINDIRTRNQQMFRVAAATGEVRKLVTSIAALVKKNMDVVSENEAYVKERHEKIRRELEDLKTSDKVLQYFSDSSPHLIDGHH